MESTNTKTIYDNKKKGIMKYYDEMNDVVSFHKKSFTKLLQDLNKSNYVGDVMNQSVDDFMASIFPKFKEFKEKVNSSPFEQEIKYVYDLNKKEYIDVVELPDRKIIKEYDMPYYYGDIHLYNKKCFSVRNNNPKYADCNNCKFGDLASSTFNLGINFPVCGIPLAFSRIQVLDTRIGKIASKITKRDLFDNILNKNFQYNAATVQFKFVIDNYFNIYIPQLKLYLLNNYSKFNLFSFFDKNGLFDFENANNFIHNNKFWDGMVQFFTKYTVTSLDDSEDLKKGLVEKNILPFLELYEYEDKMKEIEPYRYFSQEFSKLIPQDYQASHLDDEGEGIDDAEELRKLSISVKKLNFMIESKEKEIEKLKSQYKMDRETIINYENENLKLKKLSGDLNDQLLDHINENSELRKENLMLKQKLIDYELISKKLKDERDNSLNLEKKFEEGQVDVVKSKKLQFLTQEKLNRYVKQSKEDSKTIEKKNNMILCLEKMIEEHKTRINGIQNENEKSFIEYRDEIDNLKSVIDGLSKQESKDEYYELLMEQNQEYVEKIRKLEDIIQNKTDEMSKLSVQHDKYKKQILKFVSNI
jgi:hypothetical protein